MAHHDHWKIDCCENSIQIYYEDFSNCLSLIHFAHTILLVFLIYVSFYLPYIKKSLGVMIIKLIGQEDWFIKYVKIQRVLRARDGENFLNKLGKDMPLRKLES